MPTLYGYACRSRGDAVTQRSQLLDAGVLPQNIFQDAASSSVHPPHKRPEWQILERRLQAGDTLAVRELRPISRRLQQVAIILDAMPSSVTAFILTVMPERKQDGAPTDNSKRPPP